MDTIAIEKRNGQTAAETFTCGYDADGSLEWLCHPNGNCVTYVYDALNRLTDVTWQNSSSNQICRYKYDLYADGQRQKVTEYGTDVDDPETVITWSYDYLNRLKQEAYDDQTPANAGMN